MALNHSTVVVVPDDGTSPVGTDEWNADHTVSGTTLQVQYNNGGSLAGMNLWRAGADIIEQRNGTNPEQFYVYNTYTDASNYERATINWSSNFNILTIGTQKLGTGVTRNVQFQVGGTNFLDFGVTKTNEISLQNNASAATVVIKNSSNAGYSSVDCYDDAGVQKAGFGYGNTGNGSATLAGRGFFFTPSGVDFYVLSGANIILNPASSGTVDIRQSTSAMALRVYNSFTDASNYERAVVDWTSTSNVLTVGTAKAGTGTARDMQLVSVGTGVTKFAKTAGSIDGFMQWGGQARVTADVNSNNTTTLAIATGLTVALQAGRTYSFEVYLSFTCTAAQGIRAAMVASGALTATNIVYDGWIVDSGANGIKGNTQATALGTVVANAAITGAAGAVMIRGTITVNVAGSMQVHFAQSVAAANNTTVRRGSYMIVHDMA